MKSAVTDQEVQEYRDDGFLVIREFITRPERDALLEAVSAAVNQLGRTRVAGSDALAGTEGTGGYYDTVFLQRLNLWKINEHIHSFFTDPRLGHILTRLSGVRQRIWHDQTLQKMPWASPTAWHLDNPYWSFFSKDAISIWIALDDATLQNGCLAYMPGSHMKVRFDNVGIGPEIGGLFNVYPALKDTEPVMAEMKAGDAGFHNGLTAHGAGANMTPHPRRAMTCAFMPDGSTFNGQQNILSKDYFSSLKVGDLLNDDARNPLVG